jgi:hypothetical protein
MRSLGTVLAVSAALAFCSGCDTACAADVAAKAPQAVAPFANGYTGAGPYFGIYTDGAVGAINGAPVGTTVTQAEVGGLLGYSWTLGPNAYAFAEAMFGWTNLNGSTQGFSLTGPIDLEQRVALGTPLNSLLSLFPNLGLPSVPTLPILPAGVTSGPQHPYLFVAAHEQDVSALFNKGTAEAWLFAPAIGIGAISTTSNGIGLDVWAEAQLDSNAVCIRAVCSNLGTVFRVGLAAKY